MQNRTFSLVCTVFLFAVVLLQLRDANAKSLIKFQDSFNLTTSPTTGQAVQQTTTAVVAPTTEAPPCRKKADEIEEMIDMYTKLGIVIQDISPPVCDSKGYYKPLQCQFNGCQCVDRYGTPISEFTPNGFGSPCQTGAVFVDESLL